MNQFFKQHQKTIIWMLVIGFLASIVVAGGLRLLAPPPPGSAEETVLIVDGRKTSRQEFAQAYGNLVEYYQQLYEMYGLDFQSLLQGTEGAFRSLPYMAQAAEGIVRSAILDQAARDLRVTIPRAELDQAVSTQYQAILDRFLAQHAGLGFTEREFVQYLGYQGYTVDALKKELAQGEEARLREERVRQLVVGPVEPTEDDLAAYYEANQDRYQTDLEKVRVAHILVREARLADELLVQANDPEADFAALARAHSLDEATREQGGETDWFSFSGSPFSEKVTDAVWLGEVGQVRLVDDDAGFHIVKLLERQPAGIPPLDEIRDTVRADYVRDEEGQRWDAWYTARRERVAVDAVDPVLAAAMAYGVSRTEALAELVAARDAVTSNDPYLPYYIGRLHEELLTAASAKQSEIVAQAEITAEDEAELARLKAEEDHHKEQAVVGYLAFTRTGTTDEQFFQRVLALVPDSAEVRYALAEMYRQAGNWVQANVEYSRAIESQPDFAAAHIGQGDVLMAVDLYGPAVEAYRKALDLQPANLALSLRLATAYTRNNQPALAQPLLEGVLAREPNNATALTLFGDLLLAQGDTAGAIARYDAAYRRSLSADPLLKLAGAYLAAGEVAEAKRRYEDAIRVFPYRPEGHLGLGDVHLELGDSERALASYRQALPRAVALPLKETIARKIVSLDPADLRTRYLLAGYYREQYKYDGAIAQYEEILNLAPGTLDALVGLGDCYLAKVQYDQALDYYRQALEVATAAQQKVSLYTQMVRVEEGRAGTGNPVGPVGLEFLWRRAQLYTDLGRYDEAMADLNRIETTDATFRTDEVVALRDRLAVLQPR